MSEKNFLIVLVDDDPVNLMFLEGLVAKEGLRYKSFVSSVRALEFLKKNGADILITDYYMPEMNGINLIKALKKSSTDTLTMMITGLDNSKVMEEAFKVGINDFLEKPINPMVFILRLRNFVRLKKGINLTKEFNYKLMREIENATAELREREFEALHILSKTAEYKDPETGEHILRVAGYSKLLAKKYGLDDKKQLMMYYAAPLHDIGKVGISEAILLKREKLTKKEFEEMKKHCWIGFNILKDTKNPYLRLGSTIALTHHEQFDGKGYPQGLKGSEIPLAGRITAIADVFDALTSGRHYKRPWSLDRAMEYLKREKGKHFDPDLVDLFVSSFEEVKQIHDSYKEDI